MFFNREAFGRDVLVDRRSGRRDEDKLRRQSQAGDGVRRRFPDLGRQQGADRRALCRRERSARRQNPNEEKRAILKRTSYRDYLTKICGLSEEAANCFQGQPLGFFGLGSDAVAGRRRPRSRLSGLCRPGACRATTNAAWKEPYIYHFPDGNASIARLLVRSLIPDAAPGHTMEDVVRAPFDYAALDRAGQPVRIRLDSTCVHAGQDGGKAQIAYVRAGKLHRVEARHAVLACFHMMIPYIAPELPQPQREALAKNVKTPLCYTNVLVRNWRAFDEPQGQFDLGADGVSPPGRRSTSRSASAATSIRAIRRSRSCCTWSMCPARRTRASTPARNSTSARASSTP